MDYKKFEELVDEGIKDIPKELLEKLDNVGIVIEEKPTASQLKELRIRKDAFLFGLYEGIPKNERWNYGQNLPDKITIFKRPIENYSQSEEKIKEIVKDTVWHEIAHHFGMDEKKARDIEIKRKTKGK
ncbi:MAG: metallopeptidase family protein [Candidatus Nealsonbacteria bacterium]